MYELQNITCVFLLFPKIFSSKAVENSSETTLAWNSAKWENWNATKLLGGRKMFIVHLKSLLSCRNVNKCNIDGDLKIHIENKWHSKKKDTNLDREFYQRIDDPAFFRIFHFESKRRNKMTHYSILLSFTCLRTVDKSFI